MNVHPPVPTTAVFNVGIVNTEAVRKDNNQREAVPQLSSSENSAAETGIGSEADRVKAPGQAPQPLTYEKPSPQANQQVNTQNDSAKDNGQDASAGKENAEDQQQQKAEQQKINELKKRDAEVRAHEQAHASIGGQHAGPPKYEYETGPDGKRYAVDGEVSIDISKGSTPEETIRKAQQVKAAALAPAEPSAQDLRVATEATQIAIEARSEVAREKAKEAQEAFQQSIPDAQKNEEQQNSVIDAGPSLEEIVDPANVTVPTRSLDINESEIEEPDIISPDFDVNAANQFIENRDLEIKRRVSVIENFYQQVTNSRSNGLQQTA